MKTAILSCFWLSYVALFSFCSASSIDDRSGEEDKLIGKWKEGPHVIIVVDTAGAAIDTIDVSATYEFFADSTFTCKNDEWFDSAKGLWRYDSAGTQVFLFPNVASFNEINPLNRIQDTWQIDNLNIDELHVGHIHEVYLPYDDTLGIYLQRVFYRIN